MKKIFSKSGFVEGFVGNLFATIDCRTPIYLNFLMAQFRPLFVYFRLDKSVDGMLGTLTQSGRMEGADQIY